MEEKYYVLIDEESKTFCGLNIGTDNINLNDGWAPISKNAYELILSNNGTIFPIMDNINNNKQTYESLSDEDKEAFYVVNVDDMSYEKETNIQELLYDKINVIKNKCNIFINHGIKYTLQNGTEREYKYGEQEQINFSQQKDVIDNLQMENILFKASSEDDYDTITKEEFYDIYHKLLYNKQYHIIYSNELIKYAKSLDNITKLKLLKYEDELPKAYKTEMDNLILPYKTLMDKYSL